jgi:hypothetical protein
MWKWAVLRREGRVVEVAFFGYFGNLIGWR